MKVYAVIAYSQHYPSADNVVKVFTSLDKATAFEEEYKSTTYHDFTDVIEYEVED